jgi:hypothetical protein
VLFPVVLDGDFRSPLLVVILVCFRDLVLGYLMGKLCEPFVVLLPLIPLPNPQVKGLDFGVFGVLGLEVFLRVDFRFLLIEWVLGTELLAKGSPRGTPTILKVSFHPWNESRDRLV